MYSPLQLGYRYFSYYLNAANGKGHGIHSPFVYDLVTLVLNDNKNRYYCYGPIEALRQQLLKSDTGLLVTDLGAGSRTANSSTRSIGSIARSALKPPKYGQLLFRLANYLQANTILEVGTSLGITTAYLASSNSRGRVFTMEGVPAIVSTAQKHFALLGLQNIELIAGNFDATLPEALPQIGSIDMAYLDGNHRLEPTLRYFNQLFPFLHGKSLVIFDDIHWSTEMEQAWQAIKADPRVTLTIDLFFIGLVFFDEAFKQPQHFTIRF
ncbi:MAG: class I SAM-dependent methyltransferase [Chitinophagaceae bacterium]|nr:class I SAM-dependent methyltransferase [Chitinophagaceae bacterium]